MKIFFEFIEYHSFYVFRTVFPSIIRSSRLYIQHQVYVILKFQIVHLVGFTIELLCTVPWTSKITQEYYIAFKKKRNIEPGTLTQHSSPSYTWDGQNNGNTRQYSNKTVCVGNTKGALAVNIFLYSFVCLRCVVPVSKHYRLCLVTVRMKVLQNGRLVRFSNTTDCWCMFS